MIFLFHPLAGQTSIQLEGDAFKHMIKARRQSVGDILLLRREDDENNYFYSIDTSSKKEASLSLQKSEKPQAQSLKKLHLGWCMIDPKSIEKVLPSLCEMGVTEISFIYASRSQKNFIIDDKRLERILLNSMQQSGRFHKMLIHSNVTLEDFVNNYPQTVILDFCETALSDENFDTVLLGPEGGFNEDEKSLLAKLTVRRLDTPMVLRSETAATAIAAKLLL